MYEKLIISVILGFLIGLEREHSGKSIGIRTVSLITLGSTLFAILSISILPADHSRIIAQIVSGIGFLGAGIIFKDGNSVHGLTTAASIWVAAAIGAMVGIGMFEIAAFGTLLILIINTCFVYIKDLPK